MLVIFIRLPGEKVNNKYKNQAFTDLILRVMFDFDTVYKRLLFYASHSNKKLISTWNNSRRAVSATSSSLDCFDCMMEGKRYISFLILTRKSVTRKHHDRRQPGSSALPPAWIRTKWMRASEAIVSTHARRNMGSQSLEGGWGVWGVRPKHDKTHAHTCTVGERRKREVEEFIFGKNRKLRAFTHGP